MNKLVRLLEINYTLARFGLDQVILSIHFYRPLRLLALINPFNWFRSTRYTQAERLRLCIESLGPIFIKFGQMLATRRDLLDDDIVNELEKLLDQVPPFPLDQARAIVEQQLGIPIDSAFESFDDQLLASASIAQVYQARLKNGYDVVVKIVRPNIEKRIRRDIEVLMMLARMADKYWPGAKRIKPVQIVREFEKTLLNELDLVREAANASELRRHFEGSKDLYVPKVYWDYCKPRVLVIERIQGIPVSDLEQLRAHKINLEVLSRKGVEVFFTQVYRNNYFHADMHPGNIFVSAEIRMTRSISRSTSASWARSLPRINATWPKILSRFLTATTAGSQNYTSIPAGLTRTRALMSLKRRYAPCANRCFNGRWQKYPSATCYCACFKPHAALIWKSSRNCYCWKKPSSILKGSAASFIHSSIYGTPQNHFLSDG